MNKFLKSIVLTLTLTTVLSSIPAITTSASTNDKTLVYYEDTIVGDRFIEEDLVGTKDPMMNKSSIYKENELSDKNLVGTNSYGETGRVLGTYTTYKTVYVTPTGQPSLGYRGGSGATVFFFESGGSSITFTATIDLQGFTFTAETGQSTSYGSGYAAAVPSTSGNHRFQFIKYYTIKTQKTAVYQYGTYKYTYYSHSPAYSLSHRWVKL